jgi:hypothetical protein
MKFPNTAIRWVATIWILCLVYKEVQMWTFTLLCLLTISNEIQSFVVNRLYRDFQIRSKYDTSANLRPGE